MIRLSKYLDSSSVIFLTASTRDDALKELVSKLSTTGKVQNPSTFYQAILDREHIVSTSIGMNTAIPHAKIPDMEDFFISIGVLSNEGVDWNSLDGNNVRLIFLIGGPEDKQTEYLQILSSLTLAIKDDERRKKLLTLNSPIAMIELFKDF